MGHKAAVASRRWQWPTERIIEADSLIATWEAAEELSVDHSIIIQPLKQIGKMKKLDKWVPHELNANKKKLLFRRVIFSYSTQQQWTISPSECDAWWKTDFIQQLVMTNSVAGPRSSRVLPKAKLVPKKVMVTVWWSAAGLIHYSFLSHGENIIYEKYAQQIDELHWKL